MTKLKEILQKSILYMLTAFFTVALWCLLSYAIDVNSNNYYSKGHHDGYQQGYTNALESKFSEFADIIKVDYERTQLCNIKQQVLVEKQLYAIMKRSNDKLSADTQRLYIKYIVKYAKEYKLHPVLVASVIHRESNYRVKLTSNVGAAGPMQVWAKWHTEKRKRHKLTEEHRYTIKYGTLVGCEILREYIDKADGNIREALYMYVGGKHHGYVKDIFAMCEYAFSITL